jgi:hypothetical protein
MANTFDQVIQRSKGVNDPQERATLVLSAIEDELQGGKNPQEVLTSIRSNRQKLAEALAGN